MDLIPLRVHSGGKVQIGNNRSRSPLCNTILSSCSMYLQLFEIARYLWLVSTGDTIESHFSFGVKLRGIKFPRQLTVDEQC